MVVIAVVLVMLNVALMGLIGLMMIKFFRSPQDDPRLSRGLQLLQSKISVLEDLSLTADRQVQELSLSLDRKMREIETTLLKSSSVVAEIEDAVQKSQKAAKLIEGKIPHEEIIDRQTSKKYQEAARLFAEGKTIEEVAEEIGLNYAEVALIFKMKSSQTSEGAEAFHLSFENC